MIDSVNFTVIDFQTTNSSPLSACFLSIIRVEERKIIDSYKTYLKPIPFDFSDIKGNEYRIEESVCVNAPSFKDIFKKIKPWLDDQIIVSYRVGFIKNVLHNLLEWYKLEINLIDYLSSQEIARVDLPSLNDPSIPNAYKHFFKADFNKLDAIEVAKANAKVVIKIVENWSPPSFERMISALYDKPAAFRTNRFGKIRFRSLFIDPDYVFPDKTELQGTGFAFLNQVTGMPTSEVTKFILSYGGKVSEKVIGTTTHLIVKNDEISQLNNSNNTELLKAMNMARNDKDISILSEAQFIELVETIKAQEEKSKSLSVSLTK